MSMGWEETVSNIGLGLICAPFVLWGILCPAWWNPKYIVIMANYILPPMLFFRFLKPDEMISTEEWVEMVRTPLALAGKTFAKAGQAAPNEAASAPLLPSNCPVKVLPESKLFTAESLIWMASFEHRLGASAFVGIAAGAVYALTQDFETRHPLYLAYFVIAVFCTFCNFTHWIGTNNELRNEMGKRVGIVFTLTFWGPIAAMMMVGFLGSRKAAGL